jgi:putative endonuclease
MVKGGFVYMLASRKNGTLYIGITNDLIKRTWEHKDEVIEGFTEKYSVKLLVWFEQHDTIESAIYKEKQLKKWNRSWKLNLIEKTNPKWQDLYEFII